LTLTSNSKQRTIPAKPKSSTSSVVHNKIANSNRTGSKQLTSSNPEKAEKEDDEEEEVVVVD
jgi:hypothetical protein